MFTLNLNQPSKLLSLLIISAAFMSSASTLAENSPKRINPTQVQSHSQQGQGIAPVYQIPFNTHCATGFTKAGEKVVTKDSGKWTDEFVCTTQVITCPKQSQPNGKTSTVHPLVVIQKTKIDPDGGQVKFRVQYKCDYSYFVIPEG
jgi:hypothetical protein